MAYRNVMIVEDHRGTRTALERFFTRHGWEVFEAGSVAGALAMLDTGAEPELLILDRMLPDGRGEAVLRRVRDARMDCFVVVSSACTDERRLDIVARLGPNCILPKPYDVAALCRA